MNGEMPSVLWIHESNPKYFHRIDTKIGNFMACSLSDWATDWTSEGITFRLPAVLIWCSLLPKPIGCEDTPVNYSVFIRDKLVETDLTTHL